MEASGAVLTSNSVFSGTVRRKIDKFGVRSNRSSILKMRNDGYFCEGRVWYYDSRKTSLTYCDSSRVRCEKKKDKKNKKKLMKSLSRELSAFCSIGFGLDPEEGLVDNVRGKRISEATETLMEQLNQMKAKEKELRRRRKEQKIIAKAARMKNKMNDSSSSSSSSESSDSECDEVLDMRQLTPSLTLTETKLDLEKTRSDTPEFNLLMNSTETNQKQNILNHRSQPCTGNCSTCDGHGEAGASSVTERIEVCMGGKCRRAGAAEILGELERRVGVEGVVVGCKCMSKCRNGPNIRVLNDEESSSDPTRTASKPSCISVNLDDVDLIISTFFGGKQELNLAVA